MPPAADLVDENDTRRDARVSGEAEKGEEKDQKPDREVKARVR